MAAVPPSASPRIQVTERIATWQPSGTSGTGAPASPSAMTVDSVAQRAAVTEHARAEAGVSGVTVRVWTPGDWIPLDFPIDQPAGALAFVTAAFRHAGWRMLTDMQSDLSQAYRALPPSLRETLPSAYLMRAGAEQMHEAMMALKPKIAAALVQLEDAAINVLRARLNTTIASATGQASTLLTMPQSGRANPLTPEGLLAAYEAPRKGKWTVPPRLRSDTREAKFLRAQLKALSEPASALVRWERAETFVAARRQITKAVNALKTVAPYVPVLADASDVMSANAPVAAARDVAAAELERVLASVDEVLAEWREKSAGFAALRRAATGTLPVFHRLDATDIVAASAEDDEQLGARLARLLALVFGGAHEVRAMHFRGERQENVHSRRPARLLSAALAKGQPPADPVRYVMERAAGTVWQHDQLVQAAAMHLARDIGVAGPQNLLDSFVASAGEQALAEKARLAAASAVGEFAMGLGLGAGLAALHFVAPPVALAIDAGLASRDLVDGSQQFEKESALSRCAFDPVEALGEEPSLGVFLATQAFNVLTVG